jgi:hypothetical protein
MGWKLAVAVALAMSGEAPSLAVAPLYDAVALNIGVNCQWQQRCMGQQRRAMKDARKFVAKTNPPLWRIHQCNRNAARSSERMDWVGFNNCIRNLALRPSPVPRRSHRKRGRD